MPILFLALLPALPDGQDDPAALQHWIRNLTAPDAAARDEAQQRLEAMGAQAVPALRQTFDRVDDPDARARIAQILRRVERPSRGGTLRQDAKKIVEEMIRIVARMQKALNDKGLSEEERIAHVAMLSTQLQGSAAGIVIARLDGIERGEELSAPSKALLEQFRSLERAEMDRLLREMMRHYQETARREGDKGLERQQDDLRRLIDRMLREVENPSSDRK